MNMDQLEVVFEGRIGRVVYTKKSGGRVFEQYQRPPGVRLIFVSPDDKVLVTKEFRHETGGYDLRLPGGKVCDTQPEYRHILDMGALDQAALTAVEREGEEETGLIVRNPTLIQVAIDGATVEWDLRYYLIDDYTEAEGGQKLEHGEDIAITWMSRRELERAILASKMAEWRSVGVLMALVLPKLRLD